MVAGSAAADAVERARRLPRLRIGLHVVMVEGAPTLPPEKLPDLVDATGRLRSDMARLGLDICIRPTVRAQFQAEIEAQFRAYHATGLALDHVNAHKHYHLHPLIANDIIAIGRRYGMRSLRVPFEPNAILAEAEPGARGFPGYVSPWLGLLARRARRAGLRVPDHVFGVAWSGAMSAARLGRLIPHLPRGLTEIYFHPATRDGFEDCAPGYRYADELTALTDPHVIALMRRPDVTLGGFSDF
jgi:hopanoid biosynthesis associated protein HpnK